ncbi:methyltransferase domain-containing protein [Hyphobacterium marinum]|uniref:Methyltransferase domain-containing protein n=1 Tax=Hyphobacterium marinum TaxID=3116574 RepID=A0ABU7M2M8_9PROT|nr:methyltransferase domain-containing protein [Hyphobacterium sp. Y6023]MEE2567767.1 methyltransferase domain-containing protein [Hyphobacterium sp. Y6023]
MTVGIGSAADFMDNNNPDDSQAAWSDYWDGDSEDSDQALGHPTHARRLKARWESLFSDEFAARSGRVRLLDAACGTGVVAGAASRAARAFPGLDLEILLTDFAGSAVAAALAKPGLAGACGFAADAAHLPVRGASLDLVVSQFGIEYAGEGAFERVASLVAAGGALHAVVHLQDGEIYRECSENLRVLDAITELGVLSGFVGLFTAIRGGENESRVAKLAQAASAAGDRIGDVLASAQPGAARQHASRLLSDMQHVLNRPAAFRAEDIRIWADGQSANIETYRLRMASMLGAAKDEGEMEALAGQLKTSGFTDISLERFRTLDDARNIAWMLTARRDPE